MRMPDSIQVLKLAGQLIDKFDVPREKALIAARKHFPEATVSRPRPLKPRKVNLTAVAFRLYCKDAGVPLPTAEYSFAKTTHGRMWRFDFAWPHKDATGGIALECDGGVHSGGRHVRGKGFEEDQKKLNAAQSLGWVVFRVIPDTLCTNATLDLIRDALAKA